MIRNCWRSAALVLIIGAGLRPIDGFSEEPMKQASTLEQVRRVMPEAFTLEVEVDRPARFSWLRQGQSTHVLRATVGKDVVAIVWEASHLPEATYYPPDTPGYKPMDYDAEGSLIVSMQSESATLRDQGVNEEYSQSTGFRVAPDGTAQRMSSVPTLSRRRPSESNMESVNLLRRILWALGRPWWADGMSEVIFEDLDSAGRSRLRTPCWWGSTSGSGVCELLVEPDNGHLVRRASFGTEGDPPHPECRSEGTRRFGDVTLGQRGEFILPEVETITVRLISFSPTFDSELVGEARKVIDRAQTRLVRVMDYRDDPDKPKVRLVPAGDLDKEK